MDLASVLKSLRLETGLTQSQLAEETGLSSHAINSYESGRRTPNSKAMAALERYFHVSGEYLRGESNERVPNFKWNDPEIMEAVQDATSILLQNLEKEMRSCSNQDQKLTFDILVELLHVLKICNTIDKTIFISLLQKIFFTSTHFIDICKNTRGDIGASARIENAKQTTLNQYKQILDDIHFFLFQ